MKVEGSQESAAKEMESVRESLSVARAEVHRFEDAMKKQEGEKRLRELNAAAEKPNLPKK